MRRYVIEREIPKVGSLTADQFCDAAKTSNAAINKLGPEVQWVQSLVTADKLFCTYLAKDEAIIRRHAEVSGFPASKITLVTGVIDPSTARE
jgi:Protein of unknown function (DUF4242)